MHASDLLPALSLGASAFVVGLSGAMSPGPFLTTTITETLRRGRLAAFGLLVGHAVLEAFLLVGFAFGLQAFLKRPAVATALALLGGAYLLWMGAGLLRGAWDGSVVPDLGKADAPLRFGPVVQGAAVSIGNPYWTLWWVTIGVTLAAKGLEIGLVGVLAFFLGHQLADLAWYSVVILAVHSGRRVLSPPLYRGVMAVLAVALLGLGAWFVWGAAARL